MFLISPRAYMVSGTFLPILGMFLLAFSVAQRTLVGTFLISVKMFNMDFNMDFITGWIMTT